MTVLVPVTPGFGETLAALHALSFPDPWDAKSMGDVLAMPGTTGWIAMGDEPLGFIIVRAAGGEAEVITFCTIPAARRKGIGGLLLDEALAWAEGLGLEELLLEVAEDNTAALALYRSRGFAHVGRRKGYYAGPGEGATDAIVLARPF